MGKRINRENNEEKKSIKNNTNFGGRLGNFVFVFIMQVKEWLL